MVIVGRGGQSDLLHWSVLMQSLLWTLHPAPHQLEGIITCTIVYNLSAMDRMTCPDTRSWENLVTILTIIQ